MSTLRDTHTSPQRTQCVERLRPVWIAGAVLVLVLPACTGGHGSDGPDGGEAIAVQHSTSSTTQTLAGTSTTPTTITGTQPATPGAVSPTRSTTPGSVAPIRTITPGEWTVVHSTCLTERGFAVTITPDGGISSSGVPSEQQPALQAAIDECGQLYPIDPMYLEPLGRDQLRALYDWYVDVSVPCLEDLGYTGFAPSTFDVLADTYSTGPWTPYGDIEPALRNLQDQEWYDLQEACPQSLPLDHLFGS